MGHFVPHTDDELSADARRHRAGLPATSSSRSCPEALRLAGGLDLAPGLSEPDVLARDGRLAARNRAGADLVCFAGAGAYDHDVPVGDHAAWPSARSS